MSTLYRQIQIDTLDPDVRYYIKRKAALDDKLCKMYDKREDTKSLLIAARAKKTAIEAEKLTADNIYKVLIYFDKLYAVMDEFERRKFMESLVSEVHVYEERKPNGQWLKSIKFKLPIIEEDMELCLDNETHVEVVVQLSQRKPDAHIDIDLDLDELDVTAAEAKATYQEIKDYVFKKFGLKVSSLNIAQTKTKYGIIERENYYKGKEGHRVPNCPKEKEDAIVDALKYFKMI